MKESPCSIGLFITLNKFNCADCDEVQQQTDKSVVKMHLQNIVIACNSILCLISDNPVQTTFKFGAHKRDEHKSGKWQISLVRNFNI